MLNSSIQKKKHVINSNKLVTYLSQLLADTFMRITLSTY